jgi:hypothetical protein
MATTGASKRCARVFRRGMYSDVISLKYVPMPKGERNYYHAIVQGANSPGLVSLTWKYRQCAHLDLRSSGGWTATTQLWRRRDVEIAKRRTNTLSVMVMFSRCQTQPYSSLPYLHQLFHQSSSPTLYQRMQHPAPDLYTNLRGPNSPSPERQPRRPQLSS